jgi:hypothetical protein
MRCAERAIGVDSFSAVYRFHLALLCERLEQYREADKHFRLAIKVGRCAHARARTGTHSRTHSRKHTRVRARTCQHARTHPNAPSVGAVE